MTTKSLRAAQMKKTVGQLVKEIKWLKRHIRSREAALAAKITA